MDALKTYIKDHKFWLLFYAAALIICFYLLIYAGYVYFNGVMRSFIVKGVITGVLGIPVFTIIVAIYSKGSLLAYLDCKKKETVTEILCVSKYTFKPCRDYFNGAYCIVYCVKNKGDRPKKYWVYRKDLIYDKLTVGKKYKITYYKYSGCICSIDFVDGSAKKKRQKKIKDIPKNILGDYAEQKEEFFAGFIVSIICICLMYFSVRFFANEINVVVVNTMFCIIGVVAFSVIVYLFIRFVLLSSSRNPKITKEKFEMRGIPNIQRNSRYKQGFSTYVLSVADENGREKSLLFRPIGDFQWSDICDSSGYMGYGNFIGSKFEIEYCVASKRIKSMRKIEDAQPDESYMIDK